MPAARGDRRGAVVLLVDDEDDLRRVMRDLLEREGYTVQEARDGVQALDQVDRDIVFSLCQYGRADVWKWGAGAGGNLWRTTGDIADHWQSMSAIGFGQDELAPFAGPGHWNDPDMLEVGNGHMTGAEYRTHISLWAVLAAPLIAGHDVRSSSPETVALLTNREVIAIDQDPLNMIIRVGLATSLLSAGRDEEASRAVDTLMELAPDYPGAYGLLALNVAQVSLERALAFAERFHGLLMWHAASAGLLAGLLRRKGDTARAADLMAEAGPPEEYGNAVGHALYHLASGETDRAFDFMDRLVDQRHPFLMMVLVGGPYAPALRASARWPSFARKIGQSHG